MSETREASCASMDSTNTRTTIRKVIIAENDEDPENFSNICDDCYSERLRSSKQTEGKCDEIFSRRRVTSISVHSVAGGEIKKGFRIACLICQRKIVCPNTKSSSFLAYYICDDCMESEKEQTRALEAALKENKEKLRSVSVGCTSVSPSRCDCKNCVRRETLEKERLREVELLRSYWNDLKRNIRLMFRNGLTADMCSLKGKKYDIERLRRHVEILTEKDSPQLYRRLESIGYEHVMNLKSDDLWQILVAPQVVPALIELYDSGADNEKMELERAKLFIESLLDRFTRHQETVRNMSSLLAPLDEKYLKQFGISWKVVNHRIFDRVIYQDELLINYLPKMEKVLKCDLIVPEETEDESASRIRTEAARNDIPQGALELARSFRVLHNLMITSREIFKKAESNLAIFSEQQDILHQLSRKAKQELFEESVEFFETQRKVMRNRASRKRHFYRWHPDFSVCGEIEGPFYEDDDNSDSDTDAVNFTRRIYELIEEGPPASVCVDHNGEVAPCIKCKDCSIRHCSCEECRIAHIITCGLLDQDAETAKNLVWRKRLSESGISDEKSKNSRSRKRRASSEKSEYYDAHDSPQAQAVKALISFHDSYNKRETAYGDWQVPYHYHDFEEVGRCLNEKNDPETSRPHGKRASYSESACFVDEDFMCSKEFAAAVKAVAKQMGCDIKGEIVDRLSERSPSAERSPDRLLSRHNKENERRRAGASEGDSKRDSEGEKENLKCMGKMGSNIPYCIKKQLLAEDRRLDACEVSSTSSDQSTSSDGDWTHVQFGDRVIDRESWENLRDKFLEETGHFIVTEEKHSAVVEGDQGFLEEVASGKITLLSATDIVGEVELDVSGKKDLSKPPSASSSSATATAESCQSSGRNRKKSKDSSTKQNDCGSRTVSGGFGIDAATLKQQEDNKKLRIMDAVKDFFTKGSDSEMELANLRAVVWAAQQSKMTRPISVSHAKISTSKKKTVDNASSQNGAGSTGDSKSSKPIVKSVVKEEITVKAQASTTASNKRDAETKPGPDLSKAVPVIEKKVKARLSVGASAGRKVGAPFHGRSVASLLSASVDLHRDNMDEKDKSKIEKLIAQAAGARLEKMASAARRMESECERHRCCDTKADFFCSHSECENEDYSEDAEEDSDEEWSDCDEHKHPPRHHSCDNKKQFDRTPSSSRREARHGHCDCCYCEMFGHTALETARAGRVPQIRERLRQKLQRRNGQEEKIDESKSSSQENNGATEKEASADVEMTTEAKPKAPIVPDAPIEVILDYINEKDNAAAQAAANKAAKRLRQKMRKQEEKEKLEMEKKRKEELRKTQQAEAMLRKKEQQAAQQAANREKAVKAEEKRKKAAEERAREQRRQKELRDQERHNKRQERLQRESVAKESVVKKPVVEIAKKGAKKQGAENKLDPKQGELNISEADENVKVAEVKPYEPASSVSLLKSRENDSPKPKENHPARPPADSTSTQKFKPVIPSLVQLNPSPIRPAVESAKAPSKKPSAVTPIPTPVKPALQQVDRQIELGRRSMSEVKPPTPNQNSALKSNVVRQTAVAPRSESMPEEPMSVRKSCAVNPVEDTLHRQNSIGASSLRSQEMNASPVLVPGFIDQINPMDIQQKPQDVHTIIPNGETQQLAYNGNLNCAETPSSSNSSASSSLSSVSTQQSYYELNPYFQAWAPNSYDGAYTNFGMDMYPMPLGLPTPGYYVPFVGPNSEPQSFNGSPFFDTSNAFGSPAVYTPSPQDFIVNEGLPAQATSMKLDEEAPPGSSHFTAAVIAKRNETRKAFLSAGAPNPLTNYELETKQLAAEAGPNSLYPHLDPVIFAPGDPRISSAIASMKFDPHEAFKPRPDAELEFLDPLELEIEHFKRLMWESKGDRVPLRELPKVELENDANAVFHFAPLV